MAKSRTSLLRFFERAGSLKSEPRRGWKLKLGMEHPESVADHAYRVAVMGMVYSDLRGLDTEKVLRMALLHDLPEAIVGDSTPGERTAAEKRRLESKAMREILRDVAEDLSKEYGAIWHEYEEKSSPEARLVSELDKVEMAIQASDYRRRDSGLDVEEFVKSARNRVRDPELIALIDTTRTRPRAGGPSSTGGVPPKDF